jgi:hypothetical protein
MLAHARALIASRPAGSPGLLQDEPLTLPALLVVAQEHGQLRLEARRVQKLEAAQVGRVARDAVNRTASPSLVPDP